MKKKHPIIFICGLGGTGKSTLADKLNKILPIDCEIVRLDWYLKHSTGDRKNRIKKALESGGSNLVKKEENPFNWNDFEKLKDDLLHFQQESELDIKSAWNQKTGEKDTDIQIKFKTPNGLIICEGIYLLHPEIASIADFIILLRTTEEQAVRRMEQRDAHRSSKEYLAYKSKLQKEYDVPYFNKYAHNASVSIDQIGSAFIGDDEIRKIAGLIINKLKIC
ncbi:MAG: AAA family ATPase [Parcubacteria group bacterium]|jgi:uridine kinase